MATFAELQSKIQEWADMRGILSQGITRAQADKTMEEAQELRSAIYQDDRDAVIDGIGDTLVTLIIQAELNDLNVVDCLEAAWLEIRDRKGSIQNGQFVREVEDE